MQEIDSYILPKVQRLVIKMVQTFGLYCSVYQHGACIIELFSVYILTIFHCEE